MVAPRDGGRAALGGFLYQIIASIGLRAAFESREEREDELAALLSVDGNVRIEHEKFDSDVVVERLGSNGGEISLIQLKFSRQVPPAPISPSEYRKIVRALVNAGIRAAGSGKKVASFHLITNRTLSAGSPPKFSKVSERDVADRLAVATNMGSDRWLDGLMMFGRAFGRDDREIERGIFELIGRVFHETNAGIPIIERSDLVQAIVGCGSASPIRREDLQTRMAEDLRRVAEDLWPRGKPSLRKQWDEMSRVIFSEGRALLVLVGEGGSGKSTALADWLLQRLGSEGPQRPCVSMSPPDSNHASWIADIVADWSDLPPGFLDRRGESPDRVIGRLVVANPDLDRPILVLGLDGLDETTAIASNQDAVRRILDWFRREDEAARAGLRTPAAALIVTSRSLADIENRFLSYASSGFRATWAPTTIPFDDFSDDDLHESSRVSVPMHSWRFQPGARSTRNSIETIDDQTVSSSSRLGRASRPIDPEVHGALRHPSMWRAFVDLSSEVQGRALDGEPAALESLARGFTEWFCRKVQRRQRHLTIEVVMEVLAEIARREDAVAGPREKERDWCDPARSAGLALDQARTLFTEARSAGYIRCQARNLWTWRHAVCPRYLRAWIPPESE